MKIKLLTMLFAFSSLFSHILFAAHQHTLNPDGSIEYTFDFTQTKIILTEGDINQQPVEAIVNAANEKLQHGGGVAKAISNAAGPALQAWSDKYNQDKGELPIGAALASPAFNLEKNGIKHIIHTVGPRGDTPDREAKLKQTYTSCLALANTTGISSIAFPAISTKIFGYPIEQATPVTLQAMVNFLQQGHSKLQKIYLVVLGNNDKTGKKNFTHYQEVFDYYCIHNVFPPIPQESTFSFKQLLQSPKLWIPTAIIATVFAVLGGYVWWKQKKAKKQKDHSLSKFKTGILKKRSA